MLSIDNIQVYTELLSPPEGYVTEQALALSYSLDLAMVLAASVSLFLGKELDGSAEKERYDVLVSLQEVKKKLRIFCQSGQIAVPPNYNMLYQLIEPAINMVPIEKGSFHPKLWLLRFKNKDTDLLLYRLIVLSKNLTDTRDWDVCYYADGIMGSKNNQNKDLIAFLKNIPGHKEDRFVRDIINDVGMVSFDSPCGTDYAEFFGFPSEHRPFPASCSRSMIISPFIRKEQLQKLPVGKKNALLISRQEELDKIASAVLSSYDCFVLKDTVIDGETIIDEEIIQRKQNKLHAKLYVWEEIEQKSKTHIFIGSANCSNAAFSLNSEAMVHIVYSRSIWEDLCFSLVACDDDNQSALCRPYFPMEVEPDDPELDSIKKLKRSVTLALDSVIIDKEKSSLYTMTIPVKKNIPKHALSVQIAPLSMKDTYKDISGTTIVFDNLSIEQLTSFFVVFITGNKGNNESFVMKLVPVIPDDIQEARERLLMRHIFTSMKKLLSYIAYLLEIETFDTAEISLSNTSGQHSLSEDALQYDVLPLYEKLLVMAAEKPEQLKKIDFALATLKENNELNTNEFDELITFWESFRKYIPEECR